MRWKWTEVATARWVLVSILTASMVLLAWDYTLGLHLEQQIRDTAETVNKIGRQRMLAQAVIKNAALLASSAGVNRAAFDELVTYSRILRENHNQLRPVLSGISPQHRLALVDRAIETLGSAAYLVDSARNAGGSLQPVLEQLSSAGLIVVPQLDALISEFIGGRKQDQHVPRNFLDLLRGLLLAFSLLAIIILFFREMVGNYREQQLLREAAIAREQLDEVSAWQSAILEYAGFAIIAVDERGTIKTFNRAAEQMLGYAAIEMVGVTTPNVIHDAVEVEMRAREMGEEFGIPIDPPFEALVYRAKMNLPNEREWTYVRRDGSRFPVLLNVTALRRADGSIKGYLGLAVDITDRKKAEQELRAATSKAEKASAAKSEFLANISHEIRTPMNGVIGFSQLLAESELSAEQSEYVSIIRSSAEALLLILNDILDYSKIEAGKLEVELRKVQLAPLLDEIAAMLSPRLEGRPVSLRIEWGENAPSHLRADPGRLRQVLLNLVGNAIKFTLQGSVVVLVGRTPQGKVRVEVQDTGIGIPAERHEFMFEKFSQADSSTTKKFGGTGLGLAISKQLTQLMQGEIGFTSEPGKGSTFWIQLPAVHHLSRKPLVLVAEDNIVNQQLIELMLVEYGYLVDLASDGAAAIEKVCQKDYDIVLMDCQMPGVDGIEATRQIRALGHRMPILAVTANAVENDREQCFEAGMNDFLTKPIHGRQLRERMEHWLENSLD